MLEVVCCVCGKVKRSGEWVQANPLPGCRVSHGYCRQCADRLLAEVKRYRRQRMGGGSRAVA